MIEKVMFLHKKQHLCLPGGEDIAASKFDWLLKGRVKLHDDNVSVCGIYALKTLVLGPFLCEAAARIRRGKLGSYSCELLEP